MEKVEIQIQEGIRDLETNVNQGGLELLLVEDPIMIDTVTIRKSSVCPISEHKKQLKKRKMREESQLPEDDNSASFFKSLWSFDSLAAATY